MDAVRFERAVAAAPGLGPRERAAALAEALALWRGPALADVADQSFARVESARLDELRLVAQELRLEAMLELGQHASVLPSIEALVSRHPERERLRYLQMLALYRAGTSTRRPRCVPGESGAHSSINSGSSHLSSCEPSRG